MRKYLTTKRALVLGVVASLAIAAGAYAWLSTTGSGSGSGATSAATTNLSLTSSVPLLGHIGDSQPITVSAQNTNASPQQMANVTITVTPNDLACPAGSFTVGSGSSHTDTVLSAVEVPASSSGTVVASDTVHFNDVNSAQNACLAGYSVALSGS